jgi:hypothetical protein
MEMQALAEEYESKTDEELLRLSLDSEQLTYEANVVLKAELGKRRINSAEQLENFRRREEQNKAEQSRNTGTLFFLFPYGIGRKRFGKADYIFDHETGIERFKTTVFIVLFWIPLIPTRTYIVERKRKFLWSQTLVLEQLPLDWEQVLKVWLVAATGALLLIWLFRAAT